MHQPTGVGTPVPFRPVSSLPDARDHPSPRGPAGRKGAGTCPAQGGGEHLGVRARGRALWDPSGAPVGWRPGSARPPATPRRPGPGAARAEGRREQWAPGGGGGGGLREHHGRAALSLQDSQLVARFQRRCGLFPAPDEGPSENGAGPADGEAQMPELGHLPAAKGKGAGEPANGLRRLAAPQVTTGQVFAEGEVKGADRSAACVGPADPAARRGLPAILAEPRGPRRRWQFRLFAQGVPPLG